MEAVLRKLEKRISKNKTKSKSESYVAKLHDKGTAKIAQKVGEEGVELALAIVQDDKKEIISESADLLFHMMVALDYADLSLEDVTAELAKREGISGLEEKRSRGE